MRARHSWISDDIPNRTTSTNYVSVDNLQMLQTARLVCSGQRPATATDSSKSAHTSLTPQTLTQSCSNLKSAISPAPGDLPAQPSTSSPGALRVRTHFISPPLRVVKSFHGKTSFGNKLRAATSGGTVQHAAKLENKREADGERSGVDNVD